jgi:hypothetical protein
MDSLLPKDCTASEPVPGFPTNQWRPVKTKRDLRIDFIRGLALFIIFLDHNVRIPGFEWIPTYTLGRFSFIDAADVFFFLSGYVSGLVYTPVVLSGGLTPCLRKAGVRCLQLYLAETALLSVCFAMIRAASKYNIGAPARALRDFSGIQVHTIFVSTWWRPPSGFGILPVYIVLIAALPFGLCLLARRPRMLALSSLSLYLFAQVIPSIQIYHTDGGAFEGFDPLAWQLVFVLGAVAGFKKIVSPARLIKADRRLVLAAIAALGLIALIRIAPSEKMAGVIHTHALSHVVPSRIPLTDKPDLGPLRLVNLALWIIVAAAVSQRSRFLQSRITRVVIVCGQNSLVVYCAGIVLNYLGLVVLSGQSNGKTTSVVWSASCCVLLVATAFGWQRLKDQSRGKASRLAE